MRVREPAFVAALAIGAALLNGCGASLQETVPYLTEVQNSRMKVRGAEISLRFRREKPTRQITGELIAADVDSVWILSGNQLTALPTVELPLTIIELSEGVERWMPALLRIDRPDGRSWRVLARHARFPQGIPPGLDRTTPKAP